MEVEGFRGLSFPQPEQVGGVSLVSDNRRVVGNAVYDSFGNPVDPVGALFVNARAGMSAKLNVEGALRTRNFPGISVVQPFVCNLHLPAIFNVLIEDAELIANSVAERRNVQCGK